MDDRANLDLVNALHRVRLFLVSVPADSRYLAVARHQLESIAQEDPRLAGLRGVLGESRGDAEELVSATTWALEILEEGASPLKNRRYGPEKTP